MNTEELKTLTNTEKKTSVKTLAIAEKKTSEELEINLNLGAEGVNNLDPLYLKKLETAIETTGGKTSKELLQNSTLSTTLTNVTVTLANVATERAAGQNI